jgi:hypothetical protein
MISVAATTGLLKAIAAAGGDVDQILRRLELDRSVFSNPEGFIASTVFARLLEEAARSTADDCFGLHFGEHYNPKNIGLLAYVVLNSPTIKVGFENIGRYLRLHNEAGRISFAANEERVHIRFLLAELAITDPRQHNEYSMAVALNTIRLMVGSQWTPQEVQFAHDAPAQTSEHLRVFRAPVLFGCAANAFVIERDCIERQVPAADPRLYRILKQQVEHVFNELPREDDLLVLVRRAIAELMRMDNQSWRIWQRKQR